MFPVQKVNASDWKCARPRRMMLLLRMMMKTPLLKYFFSFQD